MSLLGQVKDEKGTLVARLSHDTPIEGPLAELEAAQRQTTVVKRTLRLPPGRYVLETAVQDRESGRVGARRSAFEIPTPAAALSLGSVAIVRADEVGAAEASSDDPLRAGTLRATPLLGRSFPEGTPAVSLLLSLYAGPAAVRPEVELEFRKDGQTVAHATPQLPAPGRGRAHHVRRQLPDGEPRPGPLRGLGARSPRRRRGLGGDRLHAHAAGPRAAEPALGGLRPQAPGRVRVAAGHDRGRKGVATPLATILERAGRYVREYEETFRNLVAEESYRQWGPNPNVGEGQVVRTLRSDLVFVRLPGPLPWGTFRDVYEVDGQKVRDRERRLEKLFFAPKASDFEQAEAILNESSRYNLGRAYRNVNVPALGLLFLRPENQKRLAFKRKGTRTIAGFTTAEVAFEEKASPTLVHDRWKNDVPASGRFWIDETRGSVLRTEIDVRPRDGEVQALSGLLGAGPRVDRVPPRDLARLLRARHDDGALQLPGPRADRRRGPVLEVPEVRGLGRHRGGAAPHLRRRRGRPGKDGASTRRRRRLHRSPSPRRKPRRPCPGQRRRSSRWSTRRSCRVPSAVVLQKAGDYVVRYEQAFRNVAAEERYEQTTSLASSDPRSGRQPGDGPQPGERVRSEVVFTMLPGAVPWTLLRDVLEVDGRVQREAGRLEPLFRASPSAGLREAEAITRESERLILGPTTRTLNVPTMALAYLHPDNRDAFRFERKGRAAGGRAGDGRDRVRRGGSADPQPGRRRQPTCRSAAGSGSARATAPSCAAAPSWPSRPRGRRREAWA